MQFELEKAYEIFKTIRYVEEEIIRLYPTDKIKSPVHLSIGQESIAVGVCMALSKSDIVFSNYRGHGHYIAKGGCLNSLWAELYGRENGLSEGVAGSMHLGALDVGFIHTSAIVGSAIPNAVGFMMAEKMQKKKRNVICFHGDGAVEEGVFWESINFASLKNIPILFICENNQYAIYSHQKARMLESNIVERVKSFGIDAVRLDNHGCEDIYRKTQESLDKLKKNGSPILLEIMTDRFCDHVGPTSDRQVGFRSDEELDAAILNDEMTCFRKKIDQKMLDYIDLKIVNKVNNAIKYAEKSTHINPERIYDYIYAK